MAEVETTEKQSPWRIVHAKDAELKRLREDNKKLRDVLEAVAKLDGVEFQLGQFLRAQIFRVLNPRSHP